MALTNDIHQISWRGWTPDEQVLAHALAFLSPWSASDRYQSYSDQIWGLLWSLA